MREATQRENKGADVFRFEKGDLSLSRLITTISFPFSATFLQLMQNYDNNNIYFIYYSQKRSSQFDSANNKNVEQANVF